MFIALTSLALADGELDVGALPGETASCSGSFCTAVDEVVGFESAAKATLCPDGTVNAVTRHVEFVYYDDPADAFLVEVDPDLVHQLDSKSTAWQAVADIKAAIAGAGFEPVSEVDYQEYSDGFRYESRSYADGAGKGQVLTIESFTEATPQRGRTISSTTIRVSVDAYMASDAGYRRGCPVSSF